MKGFSLKVGIFVTGLLLTAGPALAQKPSETGGGGGAGSGGGADRAASSSGGGMNAGSSGNVASSGGSSASSSGGGGDFGGFAPSASAVSSPSVSMGDRGMRQAAPEHRFSYSRSTATAAGQNGEQRASPRSSNGDSSGERAVSRGAGTAARESGARDGAATSRRNESTPNANNGSGTQEVPNWSRPRGDRPVTDTAVTRTTPRPDPNNRGGYYPNTGYGGYYDPYYNGGYGYGYGFNYYNGYYGYPFYAPLGWGYGIPYGFYDPYAGDPYEYGAGYGAYSSRVYSGRDQGALKLKVKPRNAKVYVDGYFVGNVDQFDGAFQKLTLNGGRHKVELRAEGYESTEFDVLITPTQTITFAGDMKKSQ